MVYLTMYEKPPESGTKEALDRFVQGNPRDPFSRIIVILKDREVYDLEAMNKLKTRKNTTRPLMVPEVVHIPYKAT